MRSEIEAQLSGEGGAPFPSPVRRPDWRSSSAKRLMPQLQVQVPLLRRWRSKTAVAVERPFLEALGGASEEPSHDLDAGDVIWMVPELVAGGSGSYRAEARALGGTGVGGYTAQVSLRHRPPKLGLRRSSAEQYRATSLTPPLACGSYQGTVLRPSVRGRASARNQPHPHPPSDTWHQVGGDQHDEQVPPVHH
ncbi:MAG: hypothetical protein F4Z07_02145 [Dehalococcoidia bacterium]|nr:hypothetical protein [Dehalococcoidia bacterium]